MNYFVFVSVNLISTYSCNIIVLVIILLSTFFCTLDIDFATYLCIMLPLVTFHHLRILLQLQPVLFPHMN